MPYYQKLGEIPKKHHIWFHRNGATPTYKNEGIAYEHVFTTQGFDEAYSIMYHLRPPTRVRKVELIKQWEPKKVADSPLRHHHLKTANIPRRGDLYTSRIPMLFNQDMTAYRAKPAKAYDKFEYYKNGGADEIIFVFRGGGVLESVFGKLPYRAEDYIVIPRGITYRLVPDKVEEEDYLILESVGPVRIPQRYLNHEGQIKMGAPYSERDLHAPTELITIDKEEDVDVLIHSMPSAGMAIFIRSRLMPRISSRSPAPCINRRRFIRHLRFEGTSCALLRPACSIRIPRRSKFPGCTITSRRTKYSFMFAAISARDGGLRVVRSPCIRAAFRTAHIRARSWRARMQRVPRSSL